MVVWKIIVFLKKQTISELYDVIKENVFMEELSVKKNFVYSTAFQILSMITPFITAPYVSRILGAGGLGIQSYTTAVQAIFLSC